MTYEEYLRKTERDIRIMWYILVAGLGASIILMENMIITCCPDDLFWMHVKTWGFVAAVTGCNFLLYMWTIRE